MDRRLTSLWWTLRVGLGLTAFLAGCDKFVGLLADWPSYVGPVIAAVLPIATATFMRVVGVVEIVVGLGVLAGATRLGGYVLMGWLLAIAANLITTGAFLDVAVRDVVMALAAFALARLSEVLADAAAQRVTPAAPRASAA